MSIADKLQTIQNIKENIKTAINNKGGNVGDDFTQYSTAIDGLSTGGGDITKIDVAEAGIKFGNSTFKEVPEYYDFEGITDMSNLFENCSNLKTIPLIDTSNVTSLYYAFRMCINLEEIPQLITSKVNNMYQAFGNCYKLHTIPPLDANSINTGNGPFGSANYVNLINIGGFIGLKHSWNSNYYGFNMLPNLTYQSCINILNGLYDFTGNGETPNSSQGILKVHQNFIDAVGDEISIGTNKGWTITA